MILDDIVHHRRADVVRAKRSIPQGELERRPAYSWPRRGFAASLNRRNPAVIAEVKKASPSRGLICKEFDPVGIARAYERNGAAAVSVLTEERFFQGHRDHLDSIRRAVGLPVLRKDFLIEPYQVVESRAWGADAVLLIVAILDDANLREMLAAAEEAGLDTLVETHDEGELERAAEAGAEIIGINNRDLRTFVTTLATAERLRPFVPSGAIAVAESGIHERGDIVRLREAGFCAFLVGEALMRAPDPGAKLRELLGGL
jgi:indole-3-glycerol phosphate synthase